MAVARACCASGASRKPPTPSGELLCSTRITRSRILGCRSPFARWDLRTSRKRHCARPAPFSTRWRRRGRSKRRSFTSQVLAVEGKHRGCRRHIVQGAGRGAAWLRGVDAADRAVLAPTHWHEGVYGCSCTALRTGSITTDNIQRFSAFLRTRSGQPPPGALSCVLDDRFRPSNGERTWRLTAIARL